MSPVWTAVIVVGLVTIGFKAAGPVLLGGRSLPPRAERVIQLVGPALLAALIATQAFESDRALVADERAAGLAAAALALYLRAPVLLVIAIAAATTALLRLL